MHRCLRSVQVFASDGITYSKAYRKSMIVIGPGQREALLFQFNATGRVRVMQVGRGAG